MFHTIKKSVSGVGRTMLCYPQRFDSNPFSQGISLFYFWRHDRILGKMHSSQTPGNPIMTFSLSEVSFWFWLQCSSIDKWSFKSSLWMFIIASRLMKSHGQGRNIVHFDLISIYCFLLSLTCWFHKNKMIECTMLLSIFAVINMRQSFCGCRWVMGVWYFTKWISSDFEMYELRARKILVNFEGYFRLKHDNG